MDFEVEGKSLFPIDMLRRDKCYPSREEDTAAIIEQALSEPDGRTVRVRLSCQDPHHPSTDDWVSFGWILVHQIYYV